MHKKAFLLAGLFIAIAGPGSAQAASCSGGIGSTDLYCSSSNGTLSTYQSWVESVYVPAAVETLMSSFAAVFDPTLLGTTGRGWVFDDWGSSNRSEIAVQVTYPANTLAYYQTLATTSKAGSDFFIDGATYGSNGANVYFHLFWTGTTAEVVNGVTNYIASYSYLIDSVNAWGANQTNGSQTWVTGVQRSGLTGSGTYNFTANTIAVPGPEAGAGIGALALGGIGFWLNRRRKTCAA